MYIIYYIPSRFTSPVHVQSVFCPMHDTRPNTSLIVSRTLYNNKQLYIVIILFVIDRKTMFVARAKRQASFTLVQYNNFHYILYYNIIGLLNIRKNIRTAQVYICTADISRQRSSFVPKLNQFIIICIFYRSYSSIIFCQLYCLAVVSNQSPEK